MDVSKLGTMKQLLCEMFQDNTIMQNEGDVADFYACQQRTKYFQLYYSVKGP